MATRRLPLPWVIAATVVVLAIAVAVVVLSGGDGGDDFATSDEVRALPIATLVEGSNGEVTSLGDLLDTGGKPMVVNLFASWCGPCIEEMPDFEQVHQAVGDEVTIAGLAVRNPPDDALGIVEQTGVTYPTFADEDDQASSLFDVVNMPTTIFLDADGTIVDIRSGKLSQSELRAALDERYGVAP